MKLSIYYPTAQETLDDLRARGVEVAVTPGADLSTRHFLQWRGQGDLCTLRGYDSLTDTSLGVLASYRL